MLSLDIVKILLSIILNCMYLVFPFWYLGYARIPELFIMKFHIKNKLLLFFVNKKDNYPNIWIHIIGPFIGVCFIIIWIIILFLIIFGNFKDIELVIGRIYHLNVLFGGLWFLTLMLLCFIFEAIEKMMKAKDPEIYSEQYFNFFGEYPIEYDKSFYKQLKMMEKEDKKKKRDKKRKKRDKEKTKKKRDKEKIKKKVIIYDIGFSYKHRYKFHRFERGFRFGMTSSITKAAEIFDEYSIVVGFRDHPEGSFYIHEHIIISTQKYLKKVYLFCAESQDDKRDTNTRFNLGPFEKYYDAKQIVDKYKKKRKYKNWKIGIDCFYIDKDFTWEKGFVSYEIE